MADDTKEKLAEDITTALVKADTSSLNNEALTIINQLVAEQDANKQKDLVYLFNQNQNKKTMVRVNKMSDLLDAITDQATKRFTERPDEISNKEMIDAMKAVSDLIEKGQKQVMGGGDDQPFIQINQQHNEVNMDNGEQFNRESRDRVKNAVLSFLNNLSDKPDEAQVIDQEESGDGK